MNIFKIEIENYRLLKNFSIDLEEQLSLVIGKNNTGKTSLLSALDKFLNKPEKNEIKYHDFNIDLKKELEEFVEADQVAENEYKAKGIKMRIFIKYTESCDLENISRIMMDLDPDNFFVVLGFEYALFYDKYCELQSDYKKFKDVQAQKKSNNTEYTEKTFEDFISPKQSEYFKLNVKSIAIDKDTQRVDESNFIDLNKEKGIISKIINFKTINAHRTVANKDTDKTLSLHTSTIYERMERDSEQNEAIDEFNDSLRDADNKLTHIYNDKLFNKIIENVKKFGGIKDGETNIEITSRLEQRELLRGNTTVVYKHDADNKLPEHYNGLGYMNLICMIFEIEIKLREFKRDKDNNPADINLLFIEEPEAHTHPQMQYVFIKNIKDLLGSEIVSDGVKRKLQCVISTHSSHIVANSDFDDIKYLKKESSSNVIAKNLKDLENKYGKETPQYQFLTQYLTISRSEIFFADKAILIEGDTERILLPTIMKKLDIEEKDEISHPLLSQNISVIEVGAYSEIYDEFIEFLGIKTLIITDLDTVYDDGKKCRVAEGKAYSNNAISYYLNKPPLEKLIEFTLENKILKKIENKWTSQSDGKLCIVYQTKEKEYNARSFEDAFIHLNFDFVKTNRNDFKGLKHRNYFDNTELDPYYLADNCIKKKTHFAMDILYHSEKLFNNWEIPAYIKEGLLWLKQD